MRKLSFSAQFLLFSFPAYSKYSTEGCVKLLLRASPHQSLCGTRSERVGKVSNLEADGLSLSHSCAENICYYTRCFSEGEAYHTTLSISEGQLDFDLIVEDLYESVNPVGGCNKSGVCSRCSSDKSYHLNSTDPIAFNLSQFIDFHLSSSPTTYISVNPKQDDAVLSKGLKITFSIGLILGGLAFISSGLFFFIKMNCFKRKKKKSEKAVSSLYLNNLSQVSASKLHQVLIQRFSVNSAVGWRTASLRTEISDLSLKSYKSRVSEEDRLKAKKLRATGVNLESNMSRLQQLFQKKTLPVGVKDWPSRVADIVHAVHARIESELFVEVHDENQTEMLKGFQGESLPFDLQAYIFRLVTGLNRWFSAESDGNGEAAGIRCLMFSVIYLRKIQAIDRRFKVSPFNIHRLLAVLLIVAAKMTEDEPISNSFWAEVTGMNLDEINVLEQELCFESGLDFNVEPGILRDVCSEFGVDVRMGLSFAGEPPISKEVSL